jgi:hypothetical protein
MVPDEVALQLATMFVRPGDWVLDPFCGSGRLLAAAAGLPGRHVGADVNPLAWLVTSAKLGRPDMGVVNGVLQELRDARCEHRVDTPLAFRQPRKVDWFSETALAELAGIVRWINSMGLGTDERLIVTTAFSAAVRDASFVRKGGWKLHRLSSKARARVRVSAWACFERRLRYCVDQLSSEMPVAAECEVLVTNAAQLVSVPPAPIEHGTFDLVLTSPPYGDSRTTVQYGAASALCLEFVSRINGFEWLFSTARDIEAACLGGDPGGSTILDSPVLSELALDRYWDGWRGPRSRNVLSFLTDYSHACAGMVACLRPGGYAVVVVGRRSVDGSRLNLDQFTIDQFELFGLQLAKTRVRELQHKRLPRRINRFGAALRADQRAAGATATIESETTLVFRKW